MIEKQLKNSTLICDFNAEFGNKKNMVADSFGRKKKQNSNGTSLYKLLSTKNLRTTNKCFNQEANITTWKGAKK